MKSFINSLDLPKECIMNFLAVTSTCTFRIQRHVITCSTTTHAFGFPWEAYSATYCIYYIPTIDAVNSVFSTTKSTLLWMDDKASSPCPNIDPGIQKHGGSQSLIWLHNNTTHTLALWSMPRYMATKVEAHLPTEALLDKVTPRLKTKERTPS